jgi:hypothetical protein
MRVKSTSTLLRSEILSNRADSFFLQFSRSLKFRSHADPLYVFGELKHGYRARSWHDSFVFIVLYLLNLHRMDFCGCFCRANKTLNFSKIVDIVFSKKFKAKYLSSLFLQICLLTLFNQFRSSYSRIFEVKFLALFSWFVSKSKNLIRLLAVTLHFCN